MLQQTYAPSVSSYVSQSSTRRLPKIHLSGYEHSEVKEFPNPVTSSKQLTPRQPDFSQMSDSSVIIDPPNSTDYSQTRPSRKEQSRLVTFYSSPPLNLPLPPQDYEGQPFPLPALPHPDIPVGGRLTHFLEKWEELTDNKWVHTIVHHSFRIPFSKTPSLSSVPIRMSQSYSPFIREEIENLLKKWAVERLHKSE